MTTRLLLGIVAVGAIAAFVSAGKPVESGRLTCTEAGCHANLTSVDFPHEAAVDDCESCHDENGEDHPGASGKEYSLSDDVPELCYMCHDENNTRKNVHDPVAEGDCLTCHSPHGTSQEFLLEVDEGEVICADCHDVIDGEHESIHGPAEAGLCTDCHNPHESDHANLLKAEVPTLCFGCHQDVAAQDTLSDVHPAFEDDCMDCHEPHIAPVPRLLRASPPELCFNCHDDVEEDITEPSNVHKGLETEESCLACHSPHASEHTAMLISAVPNLCFDCHAKMAGDAVNAVRTTVLTAAVAHPPVEDGECTECHAPHASDRASLLTRAFPSSIYARGNEESYALCFECHDSDLLTVQKTTDATEFRNGDVNLHYVHVAQEKGRSCILCHGVHGADNPHLIAGSVPFGSWQMPLRFEQVESGGACTPGCHSRRTYDNSDTR